MDKGIIKIIKELIVGNTTNVILSAAKNLSFSPQEILTTFQDDSGEMSLTRYQFKRDHASSVRGIGIDIEDVDRFRSRSLSENLRLYEKIFTDEEITYCMAHADPYPHFTARFAAKEAVAKAVGISIFELRGIEISHDPTGRPTAMVCLHPEWHVEVSLSHTKHQGVALALWLS
ncbi:MAG: 4'-phosphopantetheinyl transferase superfamily protein [Patescibacteria group bacterium]